jgi:hypothetical protein
MAKHGRIVPTRKKASVPPPVELLCVNVQAVTIIRDTEGDIIGTGKTAEKQVHSIAEFSDFLDKCRHEIMELNKPT